MNNNITSGPARIGFVGLGSIGRGICNNLIKAGHLLTVYDTNPDAENAFAGRAQIASSVSGVCENSDYIFLSLPSTEVVEATVGTFLETGVCGKVIIDTSTSSPASTRALYQKIRSAGGQMVDAPLMAGPAEAEAGTLDIVVGGDKETVDGLSFLFDSYCSTVKYVGAIGNGHLAKLAVNYCGLTQALTLATIFPVMESYGISGQDLYKILDCDALNNWMFRFYGDKYVNKNYHLDFAMALGHKDLTYAKKLFDDLNVPAFMLDGALELCRTSLANPDRNRVTDFSYACRTMEELIQKNRQTDSSSENSAKGSDI